MYVGRIFDAGIAHRRLHAVGDFLHHRRPADVLGHNPALIAVPIASRDFVAGPVFSLRANTVACGVMTPSQPPDHTIGICATSLRCAAVLHQDATERLIGEDAGEVVDAAIAFGLADDRDHLIGGELAVS